MAEKAKEIFDVTLFKRLLDYIKPYRSIFALSLICVVGLALFGALRPMVLKEAIDSQIALKKLDGFIMYIFVMVILLVLEVVSQLLFIYYASWLGQSVVRVIRVKLFKHMLEFKMTYFDKSSVGVLITVFSAIFSQ